MHEPAHQEGSVCAVCFTPDCRYLVTAGKDRAIRLWDSPSGLLRAELTGHTGSANALAVSPFRLPPRLKSDRDFWSNAVQRESSLRSGDAARISAPASKGCLMTLQGMGPG